MKPVSSYPESQKDGVMSALKNLQDKIRKLELERSQAEGNLRNLAQETTRYRDILQREQARGETAQTAVSKHSQELEAQLTSAETRCNLLEKQLDYMRKMVQTAEQDKQYTLQKTALIEQRQEGQRASELESQMAKISELEREHLKLTATQTLAENKIRELEEKLKEEKHHRKVMQERAAELQTAAETNRILLEAVSPPRHHHHHHQDVQTQSMPKKTKSTQVPKKRKKKVVPVRKPVEQRDHFRLNLAEIPFVAGKSTTPSHSVGANIQQVLSMMKKHNPTLCTAAKKNGYVTRRGSTSSTNGIDSDLEELLNQLQDEFGHMSMEHQELTRQINEVRDYRLREDLERELDHLVARMEAKGEQIGRLRRHQQVLLKKKKQAAKPRPKSAGAPSSVTNGEVEVTTTIKTKGRGAGTVNVRPVSASGKASLNFLKDMKKLQTSLRREDINWE